MPSAYFIDTNILLYAQDPKAPEKRKKAAEWLGALVDRNLAVISPQVMNEFAHNVLRKFRHVEIEQLLQNLEDMAQWCRASTSSETTIQGLLIHQRFKFSFYDATLMASALAAGCTVFLSENFTHNQRIHEMRIVDPFIVAPHALLNES
jgi:predicted nucleic acid-binding protein